MLNKAKLPILLALLLVLLAFVRMNHAVAIYSEDFDPNPSMTTSVPQDGNSDFGDGRLGINRIAFNPKGFNPTGFG